MDDIQTFTLPAGTVCQRNGIAFALTADTQIATHAKNWALIQEEIAPSSLADLYRGVFPRPLDMRATWVGDPVHFDWSDSSANDNNSGKQD